jgi:hypothetical protein
MHHPGSTGSRFVFAAVIGATALSAGACARPAPAGRVEGPPPAVTSGTADSAALATAAHSPPAAGHSLPYGWRRCTNSAENYSLGYPGNWHTTQIRPEEVCAQFHPNRFTIPPESEYPLTALNAKRVPAAPSRTGTEYERTILWKKTTVAGRTAVRFETVSTGAGLNQAGTRQYGYVIRLGQGLVSIHTTAAPGETRYAAWKTVVTKAARTLTAAKPAQPQGGCVPIRPGPGFYEGGRVATEELTTPASRCTTISVSDIVDQANPADRCQRFLVGLWPLVDGSLTYTEPVTACGGGRTVLARNVPDKTKFIVLYDIDYIDPDVQHVDFKVWR